MNAPFDLSELKPYRPRRYVPESIDLTDPAQLEPLYEELIGRAVASTDDVDLMLQDYSELESAVDQHASLLYVAMTCQTDDKSRAEAYQHFIEHVDPKLKPLRHRFKEKYLGIREEYPDKTGFYAVFDRGVKADVEYYRGENIPLETEDDLLKQEYDTVCGAMTVEFRGEEKTLAQLGPFLLDPDRGIREEAWRAAAERRLQDRDRIDDIYDKMVQLRVRRAANADCPDYLDYTFKRKHRFDYTPADCRKFHDAIESAVVPLLKQQHERRRAELGVEKLRPWDLGVDPKGRPPLKPFSSGQELLDNTAKVFHLTDAELGKEFDEMARSGLLDLENRKGKAPGGYQCTLEELRRPFIFMNAVGLDNDVRTLLHEGGHAFHALAAAPYDLASYRSSPIEFAEVASFGMEFLAGEHLNVFYEGDDLRRARREFFEGKIALLPWVATIDAFQHWVYNHPNPTREERKQAWLETHNRFNGGVVDWSDLDDEHGWLWHRQLHPFTVPLYYVEYGIAQLGALQLWVRALADRKAALADYKKALALGGSKPLPDLFEAAGLRFDFSESTIQPLMDAVGQELARLA